MARASSRQRAIASYSATGGRERAWARGSPPRPAACSAAIPARTISSFSAWTPARPPARGDGGERAQQLAVGDAREAPRVGLERRELERRRAGVDELLHVLDRPARRNRRPQRDVDDGLPPDVCDLGRERRRRVDRALGVVVGHVDDRRHAAGRGGAGAACDPLAGIAAGMDVDVDGTGEQERVAVVAAPDPVAPASPISSMRPSRIVRPARTVDPSGLRICPEIFSID